MIPFPEVPGAAGLLYQDREPRRGKHVPVVAKNQGICLQLIFLPVPSLRKGRIREVPVQGQEARPVLEESLPLVLQPEKPLCDDCNAPAFPFRHSCLPFFFRPQASAYVCL